MMDGMAKTIRVVLDKFEYNKTLIMPCSAKFASNL